MDVWCLAYSPIKVQNLNELLSLYPNKFDANILSRGFSEGFRLNYVGPRFKSDSKNLLSALQNPEIVWDKVMSEVKNGRIAGPFENRPISNLRCSPIGIVPKKTGGFRLITHLSYPPKLSVNDFVDEKFTSVKYSSFDNAIDMIKLLGPNAKMGKKDIKSAFRLLPIYPGDFDLLGFKIGEFYFIDKCLAMGYCESCSLFERFSRFVQFCVCLESNSKNVDHYLDDFFFAEKSDDECKKIMDSFDHVCNRLGIPVAHEKSEGPSSQLHYLGLLIDSEKMVIKIPEDKVLELKSKIKYVLGCKKITLRELQSLCGNLAFCSKALPAGRAFSRRIYSATSKAKKPHHYIKITQGIYHDLMVWNLFLDKFNGVSYILDINWTSNSALELFCDAAGGATKGCGSYFQGKWVYLGWPSWFSTEILKDITYLEMVPIALSVYIWGNLFNKKKILIHSDNMGVVEILNRNTSKSLRVMTLVRHIVYWSLLGNFHIKGKFVNGYKNVLADSISRKNFQKFKSLASSADPYPTAVPEEFWSLLDQKLQNC